MSLYPFMTWDWEGYHKAEREAEEAEAKEKEYSEKACEILGISRPRLDRRIAEYSLTRES